jgi:urea transport system ATP-binding protein
MLELKNVTSGYGDALIINELSCQIVPGQVTAIMGRNGMGKTTLLKTVMGLIPCRSGEIIFENAVIQNLPTFQISRAHIGYVPQGREVFEQFSVMENLRLAALGSDKSNLDLLPQIFKWFPILEERASQKAGTFSGGQQQILAIARALMTGPKILLLDEPTEGIQPSIVHEIAVKLRQIANETGLTVVLVEQNVHMVKTMADQILFMENGQIRDQISIDQLTADDTLLHTYLSV